jgi:hypothetical protein
MLLSGGMRRLLLAALAAALAAPAAASASDPIMPLGDVAAGMHCTALSVVRGTTITSFDVEVLDVIDRQRPDEARFLIRVSGPAVDATGIGPGFSGSPIYCTGADGVARNIGAVSAGIGQYGGTVGVATPIEQILAEPIQPPSSGVARSAPASARSRSAPGRSAVVGSRSLAGPLTLSGLSPSVATLFAGAARKAGWPLVTSGASPRATGFPPQPLVPGAAVSVALASGSIGVGAIGTVAYADGPSVWLFGHSLDGAGRRSLFLEDAYIHAVINNPVGAPDLSTYKLGSPGNNVGTVTNDATNAVAGRLGALPRNFPFKVFARDLDTGRSRSLTTLIADEGDVGRPAGPSITGVVGAGEVAEAAFTVLGGAPARQMADMCVTVALRELPKPARFCQRYAINGDGPNALAGALSADITRAAGILETYDFGVLHPTSIEVGLRVRRGLRQAWIVDATAPRRARRGKKVALKLHLRRALSGDRFTRTIHVRIPADIAPGTRSIKLAGTEADPGSNPNDSSDLSIIFEDPPQDGPIPESVDDIRAAIEGIARYDGVTATVGGKDVEAYRDPDLLISGDARVTLKVNR